MYKYVLLLSLQLAVGCGKEKTAPDGLSVSEEGHFDHERKSIAFDSVITTRKNDAMLTAFYRRYHFKTIWNKTQMRKTIAAILSDAGKEGLDPEDYEVRKIDNLEQQVNSLSDAEMVGYDILLTLSIQKYLWHLSNGKLNPKKLYHDWDLKPNTIDINGLLASGIRGDSIFEIVESAKPDHIIYKSLKLALKKIEAFPKDTLKTIPFTKKIVYNETNPLLVQIKRRLMYWHDLTGVDSLTNSYDSTTYKAVKKFQLRHGLMADGVIGKTTVDALNFTQTKRKQQIIANLERWRWFPKEMGEHFIIVNIPDYYLRVIKDKDTMQRKRVVVGKSKRRTPVLSATFSNIVFNPTWTVPPTILREDLHPAATANRSYFMRKKIKIYNYKGDTVDPKDWEPAKFKGYRYVQPPGYGNALGVVKFNFPNHYSVYLHDTNHRNYFSKNYRALSSGCVRVEDPLSLAQYMLNDSINWSGKKIAKLIASKKTISINLKQEIRLHQLYWTAWMEENGDLEFLDDIYHLDEDLYRKLRK